MSLSPSSGVFSGTVFRTTSSAIVLFSSLRIKTGDTYDIIASCPNAESASYPNLNIVKLSLTGLILYVPVGTPSMNFQFEVYIEITDQNDDILSDPDGVSLQLTFEDSPLSHQTGTTYSGTFSFYVTYHNFGYLKIIVETLSGTIYSQFQVVEVLKNILKVDATTIVSYI